MTKTITTGLVAATLLLTALPAFAQTAPTSSVSTKIACVGAAARDREQTLSSGFTTFSTATQAAYAARSNALNGAYAASTTKGVQAGIKSSWSTFGTTMKTVRAAWKTTRDNAWATYRTAVSACKASGVSDSAHASAEVSGN